MLRRKGRLEILGVALGVALTSTSDAEGSVRIAQLTSPVRVGEVATLVVDVWPKARCSVALQDGIAVSTPQGLSAKTGVALTWRWRVRKTAPGGTSPVVVSCGKAGVSRTTLTIEVDREMSLAEAVASVCRRVPRVAMDRFGTWLVLVTGPSSNGCRFRVNPMAAPDFFAYYTLVVVPSTARCTFTVSTHLSVLRQTSASAYPGPFDAYYNETCRSLR